MRDRASMADVWALVGRSRPHLTASQMRLLGATFQGHRAEMVALAKSEIAALPDPELAQQLLSIARRMSAEIAKP